MPYFLLFDDSIITKTVLVKSAFMVRLFSEGANTLSDESNVQYLYFLAHMLVRVCAPASDEVYAFS